MAVNESRSRGYCMEHGATEGSFREIAPDRESVEPILTELRSQKMPTEHYGNTGQLPVPSRIGPTDTVAPW